MAWLKRKRGGMKETTPTACRFLGDKYTQNRLVTRPLLIHPVTRRSLGLPVTNNNVSIDQSRNGLSWIDLSIELALVRLDVPHFPFLGTFVKLSDICSELMKSISLQREPEWSKGTQSSVHDSLKFQFQANFFRNHDRRARWGAANIFEYDDCFMLNLIFIIAWHAAAERLQQAEPDSIPQGMKI